MNIAEFRHDDWMKIYHGRWCLLTTSHFTDQYTKEIKFGGRPFESQTIVFTDGGKSAGWMRTSDRDALGAYLAKEARENHDHIRNVCENLKVQADNVLSFVDTNIGKPIDRQTYEAFWRSILIYYVPHINIKFVTDYLEPELLKNVMPILEDARHHAEPVLSRTEDFVMSLAEDIGSRTNLPSDLVHCFTKAEMYKYFDTGELPAREVLESRSLGAVTLADRESSEVYSGSDIAQFEEIVSPKTASDTLQGTVAYKGKVQGVVRIIADPKNYKEFNRGDILVTGMTRPEYLQLMEMSGGFITDAGGLLSHAAIVARELKKPCIIGTKIATKVLKDGDMVEVDAERGVVTILKEA